MHYQLIQLLIIGYCIIYFTESSFIFNVTDANKLLCYSCKGSNCEKISSKHNNLIACNKNTQLCWAGFVDQKPYRTCASRYCTPHDISLDSDVRIETCCHSNLCNAVSLPKSIGSEWYTKHLTQDSTTSTVSSTASTTKRTKTKKTTTTTTEVYVVNEIVNGEKIPPTFTDSSDQDDDLNVASSQSYGSQTVGSGIINWDRIPYDKDFSNRVVSISKLVILIIPVLLVLIF
ncbi:unnamed protein product [Rotaria sordida]|uniref:Uncharacterized protein n=1 Tax=Rotaria sordida TaxID=392033 RepID=A0A818R6U5_9BILA|nr:unnamed protein product [Rotaria sordida]CAF1477570.1 unnamed protein product [Rotaria sordida]CAF3647919.1 unnamed protein product [Rotaria sordida]CAF4037530.1 unnamed protein product [Rotaria sordida]